MSTNKVPIYMIEAFTVGDNEPYTGNPAAVCILQYDDDINDEIKQKIAATLNVSSTVFVSLDWKENAEGTKTPQNNNPNQNGNENDPQSVRRTLRCFTPNTEMPVSIHGVLGAAKVVSTRLNETEETHVSKFQFQTKSRGVLSAELTPSSEFFQNSEDNPSSSKRLREDEPENDFITLNFPTSLASKILFKSESDLKSEPPNPNGYWLSAFIQNSLGYLFPFDGNEVSKVIEDVQLVGNGAFVLIQLKRVVNELPETTLKKVKPNFQKLLEPIEENGIGVPHGVLVTIKGKGDNGRPHFYSRCFAPFYGIDEDPVTGYAHTALTPYWVNQLGLELDAVLWARQSSARGGDLRCQLQYQATVSHGHAVIQSHLYQPQDEWRVLLSGRARILFKGQLNI